MQEDEKMTGRGQRRGLLPVRSLDELVRDAETEKLGVLGELIWL